MTLSQRAVIFFFKVLTRIICRIHDDPLVKVPSQGPLILIVNHVNIIEIPIFYTSLQPRPIVAFSAAKRWKVCWTRWLLNLAGAIPLEIGEINLSALRKGLDCLKQGNILLIAPEGTRSGDGRLQKGYQGICLLAMRSKAPMFPLVFYGHENYKQNLLSLRRTDFFFAIGKPFYLDPKGEKVTGSIRQNMVDEIMYKLAAMLPPQNRGVYSDLEKATEHYLSKHPPNQS